VRILLDTNILVAGLLTPKGPPGQLLSAWLQGTFTRVTSEAQLDELARVLSYPRLAERIDTIQAQDILENIEVLAVMAADLPTISQSPDPADNVILATAVAGEADAMISGEKAHVLVLGAIEDISIMTARAALEYLGIADG